MKIQTTCDFCGAEVSQPASQYNRSHHHFCSAACNRKYYNPIQNKTLMTPDLRRKLGDIRRGSGDGKGYVKRMGRHEHRTVAEEMILHRALLPAEVVHHINGNKLDNRPENLYVFSDQARHAHWHAAPWELKGGDADALHTEAASGEGR